MIRMERINKNCLFGISLALILLLTLANLVSGVAVSGAYTDKWPVEVYPGESKQITFYLQNMAGEKNIKFAANISEGSAFAKIIDESSNYLVPPGANDIPVNVEIKVPQNAVSGSDLYAKIEFIPVPTGEEDAGMVQLAIGLSRYFKIKVVEKPALPQKPLEEKGFNWMLWGVLAIVVIAVSTIGIYFAKKNLSSQR